MAYAALSQVREIIELSIPDSHNSLSHALILAEIDRAGDKIDAHLRGRYTVPFTSVPPLIKSIAGDIAAYRAVLAYYGTVDLTELDPMVLRYREADQLLRDLSGGKATLEVEPDSPSDTTELAVINAYPGGIFSDRDFRLYEGDPPRWRAVGWRAAGW